MSSVLIPTCSPSTAAEPARKTWTRAEVDNLEAAGQFTGTRWELIEGELFDKMGQHPPHSSAICRLAAALAGIFGINLIRTQLPVEPAGSEAPHSLPQPDVAVTRQGESAYRKRHPGTADLLLVAEVSDTTFSYDAERKAKLYARAGFVEYVILDLNKRELLIFRSPRDGIYTLIEVLRPGDSFHPLSAPETGIAVADLLAE